MSRILVTGATGFVGRHLCAALVRQGFAVRAAVRAQSPVERLPAAVDCRFAGEIGPDTVWNERLFDQVDTVVHLAARVHVMRERFSGTNAKFHNANAVGTERLARAASGHVRRMVFVSSLHAMRTLSDETLAENSPCRPDTPYGQSKLEAEQRLQTVSRETGLEAVILRPAPVYGPGGGGNLMALLRYVRNGFPIPLGGITNRRSLLYVGNLVDALLTCLETPQAAGNTFVVSDGETVSISELLHRTAVACGRAPRLWPAPVTLMRLVGWMTGKSPSIDRLLGSLAVDIAHIRQTLSWNPVFTLDEGLRETLWLRTQP